MGGSARPLSYSFNIFIIDFCIVFATAMPLERWIEEMNPRMTISPPDFLGRRDLCNAEADWLVIVGYWLVSRGNVVHIADREGCLTTGSLPRARDIEVLECSTME